MLTITLTNGLESLVDEQDFSYLKRFRWLPHKSGNLTYAIGWVSGRMALMHRVILEAPRGLVVDHINHNPLDNRRENLRLCTQRENIARQRKTHGKSKYKGVQERDGRFQAKICVDYKLYGLGTFDTEEEAARAYDAAAIECFGQFATLNFPADPLAEYQAHHPLFKKTS